MSLFQKRGGGSISSDSSGSLYTVKTGDSYTASETSLVDIEVSSDGSSVLEDSSISDGTHSSDWSSDSGFLENGSASSRTSSVLTSNSSSLLASSVGGSSKRSGRTASSLGSQTIVIKEEPSEGELKKLLHRIYKRYCPEKRETVDKIVAHFVGREQLLLESLGEKYGFRIQYRMGDDDESEVGSQGSRLSDYYDGSLKIDAAAGVGSAKYYHEDEKDAGVKIQRYIIYPKMSVTVMMECTRKMNCFIVAKKKVNDVWYVVGKTNTVACSPGKNRPFVKTVDVTYHVGIDDKQCLLLEVMDGDTLLVGDGYYFGCVMIQMSDLQQKPYGVYTISRADRNDTEGSELCKVHVMTELDTEGQRLTLNTRDPLKMGFYRQVPPTLDDLRQTIPSFTELFATYIFNITTKNLHGEAVLDPELLSRENTRFYLKFLLSDTSGRYSDTEKEPGALECIWESSMVMDTGTKNKPKYKIFCPITKIEHTKLVGDRRLDLPNDHEGMARNMLVHLYAVGLNTKDGKTGPRLLSYSSIPVHELIRDAKSTAVGVEEEDVENRILAPKAKRHAIKLSLHQVENLQSPKYQQEQQEKQRRQEELERERESGGRLSLTARASIASIANLGSALSMGLGGADGGEDYDSLEEDMMALVKKPEMAHLAAADEALVVSHAQKQDKTTFRRARKSMAARLTSGVTNKLTSAAKAEGRLHGEVVIKVGRVEVPVVTKSGDDVYEEKLAKKFKVVKRKWIEDNSVNFQEACDAQNGLTMRSTLDAEFLLDTSEDKGLTSSIVVDCNAACTQHVVLKTQNAAMAGGSDMMIGDGFSPSYTLDALKTVTSQLSSFSRKTPLRVFAGGGVNPPGKSHPSRHFSRSRAFPLCQELLLSSEEAAAARAQTSLPPLPLCGSVVLSDPRRDHLRSMRKRCDPRGDLEVAMDMKDPLGGLAKKFATWKGYNYNQIMRYADEEDVRQGFLEASTLYEPSMLTQEALGSALIEQGHMRPDDESTAPSVRASMGSEVIRERQGKLLRIDRERQDMKIKFQAANVGTDQDLESNDSVFFGDIPMAMQYPHLENCDVAALETLIHHTADERAPHGKDTFDASGNLVRSAEMPKSEAEAVVWILGSCPSKHALHKAKRLFEDQLMNPHLPLLCVVLVAETRYDLPQTTAAALRLTANPFAPLIEVYHEAVQTAKRRLIAKRNRRMTKMGEKYVPSFQDQLVEQSLIRESEEAIKAEEGMVPKMVHSSGHNLCLAHYATWAEVVAGAFCEEDKMAHLTSEDKVLLAAAGDNEDEDQSVKLPKCSSLRVQMAPYLPSWSIDLVIQRVDISDDPEGIDDADEASAASGGSDEGNLEGEETKSDMSGLTSQSAGTNMDKGSERNKARDTNKRTIFGSIRERTKSFVQMIRSGSSRKARNVAAPSATGSERVSGFDELTEMKYRFERESRAAFSKELHMMVSQYAQTKETHEHESRARKRKPYNYEAREFNEARAAAKEVPGEESKEWTEGSIEGGEDEDENEDEDGEGSRDGCVVA